MAIPALPVPAFDLDGLPVAIDPAGMERVRSPIGMFRFRPDLPGSMVMLQILLSPGPRAFVLGAHQVTPLASGLINPYEYREITPASAAGMIQHAGAEIPAALLPFVVGRTDHPPPAGSLVERLEAADQFQAAALVLMMRGRSEASFREARKHCHRGEPEDSTIRAMVSRANGAIIDADGDEQFETRDKMVVRLGPVPAASAAQQ